MRLTVNELRRIIKEEVSRVMEIADADRSDFSKEGMKNTPEDQLPRTLKDFKRDVGRLTGQYANDFDFHNGEPLNLALKGNGFYSLKYVLKDLEEFSPDDEVKQMISELKKLMRELKGQVSEFDRKKVAAGSFGKKGKEILNDELEMVSSLPERLETIFAPYV